MAALAALALGPGCGTTRSTSETVPRAPARPAPTVTAIDPSDLAQGRLCGFHLDGTIVVAKEALESARTREVIEGYVSDYRRLWIFGDGPAGRFYQITIFFKTDDRGGALEPHQADHAVLELRGPSAWPSSASPPPGLVELVKVDFGSAREQVLRTSWPDVFVRRRPGQKEWSGLTWTRNPERTFQLASGSVAATFAQAREARAAGLADVATRLLEPFASVEPELLPRAESESGPAAKVLPDLGRPPADLAKPVPVSEVSFSNLAVASLAISPDGRWLATGTNGCVGLYRFDPDRGTLTDAGSIEADKLQMGVAFSRDGKHLLCVNASGRLRLFQFDASTGRGTEVAESSIPDYRTTSSHFSVVVQDLALQYDGERAFVSWTALTPDAHGSIARFDLDLAKGALHYSGDLYPPSPAGCAAFGLEATRVWTGTKVFAPARGPAYDVFKLPYGSDWSGVPSSLAADTGRAAAGHHDSLVLFRWRIPKPIIGEMRVHRPEPTRVGRLPLPGGTVERLLFARRLRLVACSKDGKVRVVSLLYGGEVEATFEHPGSVTALTLSADQRWVVTAASDRRLRVWRANLDVPPRIPPLAPAVTVRGFPDDAGPLLEPALAVKWEEHLEVEPALDFAAALLRSSAPIEAARALLEAALDTRIARVEVVLASGAILKGRLGGPRPPETTIILRAARDALAGEPSARLGSVLADPDRPLAVAALAARDAAGAALATDLLADRLREAPRIEARALSFTARPDGATEAEAAALEAATQRAVAKARTDAAR